jgi:hypothetical protein
MTDDDEQTEAKREGIARGGKDRPPQPSETPGDKSPAAEAEERHEQEDD